MSKQYSDQDNIDLFEEYKEGCQAYESLSKNSTRSELYTWFYSNNSADNSYGRYQYKVFVCVDIDDYDQAVEILIKNGHFKFDRNQAKVAYKGSTRNAIILYCNDISLKNLNSWKERLKRIERDFHKAGINTRPLTPQSLSSDKVAYDKKFPGSLYCYFKKEHSLDWGENNNWQDNPFKEGENVIDLSMEENINNRIQELQEKLSQEQNSSKIEILQKEIALQQIYLKIASISPEQTRAIQSDRNYDLNGDNSVEVDSSLVWRKELESFKNRMARDENNNIAKLKMSKERALYYEAKSLKAEISRLKNMSQEKSTSSKTRISPSSQHDDRKKSQNSQAASAAVDFYPSDRNSNITKVEFTGKTKGKTNRSHKEEVDTERAKTDSYYRILKGYASSINPRKVQFALFILQKYCQQHLEEELEEFSTDPTFIFGEYNANINEKHYYDITEYATDKDKLYVKGYNFIIENNFERFKKIYEFYQKEAFSRHLARIAEKFRWNEEPDEKIKTEIDTLKEDTKFYLQQAYFNTNGETLENVFNQLRTQLIKLRLIKNLGVDLYLEHKENIKAAINAFSADGNLEQLKDQLPEEVKSKLQEIRGNKLERIFTKFSLLGDVRDAETFKVRIHDKIVSEFQQSFARHVNIYDNVKEFKTDGSEIYYRGINIDKKVEDADIPTLFDQIIFKIRRACYTSRCWNL